MHANPFDRYIEIDSPIHHLDARVKVVVTIGFILSTALLPEGAWLAFGLSWLLILAISSFGRLGIGYVTTRSFVALPFTLAAITVMFNLPGQPLATFNLGPWQLTATDTGVVRFVSIVLRSWLSVQMAIILVATTQFPDLTHALRHLKVPQVLIGVIAFMYRYLFVLTDETLRLLRAREARSAQLPGKRSGGSLLWRARVAGNMVGQLFIRSFERSDRVYNAMLARGYRGELLTIHPHVMRPSDWNYAMIALALVLGIQWLARVF